jgi:chromosome segregation ATPase
VSEIQPPNLQDLQDEVSSLREELQIRDRLVQQLSQEVFRLVKGNAESVPKLPGAERNVGEITLFSQQLQQAEQQTTFYQGQIDTRDAEIMRLRASVKELSDRSQMLERVLKELPQLYRQKFAERLIQVRDKVAKMQQDNRQLQAKLQSANYRLAARTPKKNLELPNFPRPVSGALPPFGHIQDTDS